MSILNTNARWAALKERLRSNYWLMPTVMMCVSVGLAFGSLQIDRHLSEIPWKQGWIYQGGTDGARSLLSSLAGATLTLAGVIFSMNLVALTMASQQFGPRLLYNFVRDLGSQFTLGTFTAIFTYCIIVLREVKSENDYGAPFIPHLSVTVAGIMALMSMGVLIYYVHHVAVQIQAPIVISSVGRQLEHTMQTEFDKKLGINESRTDHYQMLREMVWPKFEDDASAVNSRSSDYIQTIDFDRLLVLATRYDLKLKLILRQGDFAIEGAPLILVSSEKDPSKDLQKELTDCFILGRRRSPAQDVEFAVNELCEIAVRALSPGINDPFTCLSCIDWLSAAMEELFQRDATKPYLCDEDDVLRIKWNPPDHAGMMDAAFNQIRQFGCGVPAVMVRLLESYARIAVNVRSEAEQASIRKHADMAIRACRDNFKEPNDLADAEDRYRKAIAAIAAGSEI